MYCMYVMLQAKKEISSSDRLRVECTQLSEEIDDRTERMQQNSSHRLSQRINDIKFWRKELETALHENSHETTLLIESKDKLEEALKISLFLLEISNSCLAYRENRVSIDLVRDNVEIHLNKVCYLHSSLVPTCVCCSLSVFVKL